jgi:hypothetical protein
MVADAFDQGVLNPLRRKFSAPPKQNIFLIRELRSTQFKGSIDLSCKIKLSVVVEAL